MSEPHRRAPVTEVLASVRLVPIPNACTTSLRFVLSAPVQGLTLVHLSAQPEPFWSLNPDNTPVIFHKRFSR
jgi:hypothetical protein